MGFWLKICYFGAILISFWFIKNIIKYLMFRNIPNLLRKKTFEFIFNYIQTACLLMICHIPTDRVEIFAIFDFWNLKNDESFDKFIVKSRPIFKKSYIRHCLLRINAFLPHLLYQKYIFLLKFLKFTSNDRS